MKLIIHGLKDVFTVDNFSITKSQLQFESAQLIEFIDSLVAASNQEAPTPPPAPKEPQYIIEPTPLMNGLTIEQFKEKGWTEQQMLDAGYVEKRLIEDDDAEEEKSTAKSAPSAPSAPPKPDGEWPQLNEYNEWVDSTGQIYDEEMHGWTKKDMPAVTAKGVFKKKRGAKNKKDNPNKDPATTKAAQDVAPPPEKAAAPAVPSTNASNASQAPSAPNASSAPSAPTVGGDDEELDSELEDIIKDWA